MIFRRSINLLHLSTRFTSSICLAVGEGEGSRREHTLAEVPGSLERRHRLIGFPFRQVDDAGDKMRKGKGWIDVQCAVRQFQGFVEPAAKIRA